MKKIKRTMTFIQGEEPNLLKTIYLEFYSSNLLYFDPMPCQCCLGGGLEGIVT